MPSRSSRRRMLGAAVIVSMVTGACSGETASTTTTNSPGTSSSTSLASTSTIPAPDETVTVLLAPFSEMGPDWTEQLFPYGEGEELLGTCPGGEGLMLGPEYGTQTPDGTWWFLDAANLRIAISPGTAPTWARL